MPAIANAAHKALGWTRTPTQSCQPFDRSPPLDGGDRAGLSFGGERGEIEAEDLRLRRAARAGSAGASNSVVAPVGGA